MAEAQAIAAVRVSEAARRLEVSAGTIRNWLRGGKLATPGGGVPDLVAAIAVCLALLGGIPELEAQALRAVLQPTADQLLGGGLDLLFHGLGAGVFFFDLLDALSPPHGGGTPERPGPVPYAADISDGRVVIS